MRRRIAGFVLSALVALAPAARARELVPFEGGVAAGTVVVRTGERRLYLARGDGTALRYKVAVGRPGKQWFGSAAIDGMYVEPAWSPPDEVRRDNQGLPDVIEGGSPRNPMGARALTLNRGEYAIHGTNNPRSIGTFASYGCIRMLNADIIDLFGRVKVGTPVLVTQ
jgi:lipoprotein-anchoring transpeptidase ErfK/SrfK